MARVSKAKAIERLQYLVDEASNVFPASYLHPESTSSKRFRKWLQDVDNTFYRIFGENSRQYLQLPKTFQLTPKGLHLYFAEIISLVNSNLDDVIHFWDDTGAPSNNSADEIDKSRPDSYRVNNKSKANKVFVIHGHDEAARETVARFLEKLGIEPIILHEKPNQGRTIIEKFEDNVDVDFAVVLLTPDDLGGVQSKNSELFPRARQNAIFELGFFIGRLGRKNVCVLKKHEVETPSDYSGVVYINLDDSGGWMMNLTRELKAAGFEIDANLAIQ